MDKNAQRYTERLVAPRVTRRDYSSTHHTFDFPNLMSMQLNVFDQFIEKDLRDLIKGYFPINSPNEKFTLNFEKAWIEEPKRDEEKARYQGKNYEASIYVEFSIINNETGEKKRAVRSTKAKHNGIFFSTIPLITKKGTFIINGVEKVVIAQIVRSPGVYILPKAQIKLNNSRKRVIRGLISEILPSRGTHILFAVPEGKETIQFMAKDVAGEGAKSFEVTSLLRALGFSQSTILRLYGSNPLLMNTLAADPYDATKLFSMNPEIIAIIKAVQEGQVATQAESLRIDHHLRLLVEKYLALKEKAVSIETEIINDKNKDTRATKEARLAELQNQLVPLMDAVITEKAAKDIVVALSISTKSMEMEQVHAKHRISYQSLLWAHFFTVKKYNLTAAGRYKISRKLRPSERLYQRTLSHDIKDIDGKVLVKRDTLLQKEHLDVIRKAGQEKRLAITEKVPVSAPAGFKKAEEVSSSLEIVHVYRDNSDKDAIIPILGVDPDNNADTLALSDILASLSYVLNVREKIGAFDDIDHLGNKRIKLINELLPAQLAVGMSRIEKFVKEKLAVADGANKNVDPEIANKAVTVKQVVNTKPFQSAVKEFFNSHQLTQFLDQENPLAELANKRRISAMGPGGISRDDPNLDIRDVHYSHYGRLCPIETPEGMNIGLIMSLASFARIDERGFLIAPYRKVTKGKVDFDSEVTWLTAHQEEEYIIAEANAKADANGKFVDDMVIARYRSTTSLYEASRVDYVDVSPKQVISIAAGAIPFLENDDANRALMGANMQRQAVPLIKPHAPLVGTGMEYRIAKDSGLAVVAEEAGKVVHVDSAMIVVEGATKKTYKLIKSYKSNQDTTINQRPIVEFNQSVAAGEVLADGPAMENAELALGQNVLVAFTTWSGYNYEDAIIISDRLVKEDTFTSIHITEHTVKCRKTRNGDEEITRELPNVGEEAKRYLDESGVITVGAEVMDGDILVGKTTLRGQVELTPEERLLQAIFGEKIKATKESSLRVSNGGGVVCQVKRFSINNGDELEDDVIEMVKVYIAQKRKIQIGDKMAGRHGNKGVISNVVPVEDMPHMEDGTPIDILLNPQGVPSRMNIGQILEIHLGLSAREVGKHRLLQMVVDKASPADVTNLYGFDSATSAQLLKTLAPLVERFKNVREIPNIEIEAALRAIGLSLGEIGIKVATPVFDGLNRGGLLSIMTEANLEPLKNKGKFKLIDGRTGQPFDNPVSVGVMYFLKLAHMVDDKIHARSVGPYSKITQQPLGGKAQNGGQRFGEMEVWALEAYGAAHTLREILTIKSDDIRGRNATYSAIIKGKKIPEPGLPESFKLLTKELQGLCLQTIMTDAKGRVQDLSKMEQPLDDDIELPVEMVVVDQPAASDSTEIEDNF